MIVFPMAGLSQRFFREGFTAPKYMLPLAGHVSFDFSISSFMDFVGRETFLFICRDVYDTPAFVRERLTRLGVESFKVIVLEAETAGQAETVLKGVDAAGVGDAEPLTIFNIDTFRLDPPDYRATASAGCLEVFRGAGDNWSFVEPAGAGHRVARTTEKDPISDLCSSGLYHFASAKVFRTAYYDELKSRTTTQKELYIAPIYNHMIKGGLEVTYREVPRENIIFCGVPSEYRALVADASSIAPLVARLDRR